MEIVYCAKCQTRLTNADFDRQKAFKLNGEAVCKPCGLAALSPMPAPQALDYLRQSSTKVAPVPPPASTPKTGTSRIPVLADGATPRRGTPGAGAPSSRGLVLATVAAAAGGVLLLLFAAGGRTSPEPRASKEPSGTIAVDPAPATLSPRERAAKELIRKALVAADPVESIRLLEQAAEESRGTSIEKDVAGFLETARRKAPRPAAPEPAPAPLVREEPKKPSAEPETKPEPKPDPKPEPKPEPGRVAAPATAVAAPDLAPALFLASVRDHAAAIRLLEPLLKDSAELELLRAAAAIYADGLQSVARTAKGQKFTLTYANMEGALVTEEGKFLRLRDGRIELQLERFVRVFGLADLPVRWWCDYVRARKSSADRRALATLCLLEGDAAAAKDQLGNDPKPLPERFWAWADELQKKRADPAVQKRDGDVRYACYAAEMSMDCPLYRAEGALRLRKALAEESDVPWVRRNAATLAQRVETPKEYVAGPADLSAAGQFRLEAAKGASYWVMAQDGDPARRQDHFVEMGFSVLPELSYRAWAYVGGCCAEVLAFGLQGTELHGVSPAGASDVPADPGSDVLAPVKHGLMSSTKTHAGHGGRKQPSRFAWVELPLPKYSSAGPQRLRLVNPQGGFAVGAIVVSATRDKPPTDAELKEWDREAPRSMGPAGPTIGLQLWFRADLGVVQEGGRVAQWVDQSGRGIHAAQAAPAQRPQYVAQGIGGKSSVRFDGGSSFLSFDTPVAGLSSLTLVLVSAASKDVRGFELGKSSAIQWAEFGPWGMLYLGPQQTGVAWRCGTTQWGNNPFWNRPGPNGGPTVTVLRKTLSREDLFVQGALVQSLTDRRAPIAHTGSYAMIGAGSDARANPLAFWAGDIAEIVFFSRAISEVERDALERTLRAKYGF